MRHGLIHVCRADMPRVARVRSWVGQKGGGDGCMVDWIGCVRHDVGHVYRACVRHPLTHGSQDTCA